MLARVMPVLAAARQMPVLAAARLIDRLRPGPLPPRRASIQKHPVFPEKKLRLVSVEACPPTTRLAAQRPFNRKANRQTEEIATCEM